MNKKCKISLYLLFLTCVGCASVQAIKGPDGTTNQLISCGTIETCYEKASEVCAGPYKIVNTNSETSGSGGNTSTTIKLLVKCGK